MYNVSNVKISCVFLLIKEWRKKLKENVEKRNLIIKESANILMVKKDIYSLGFFKTKKTLKNDDENSDNNYEKVHINVTGIKHPDKINAF